VGYRNLHPDCNLCFAPTLLASVCVNESNLLAFRGHLYARSCSIDNPFPNPLKKLRIAFVIYLVVLAIVYLVVDSILAYQYYTEGGAEVANNYSTYEWNFLVYPTIYVSVVTLTIFFFIYLYNNVFVWIFEPKRPANQLTKLRRRVGIPALISLLSFIIRAIFDLSSFFSSTFNDWLNSNAFVWVIYWAVVEIVPLVLVLSIFLTLKATRDNSSQPFLSGSQISDRLYSMAEACNT